jgi:hypothetical protein|eukprot:COSAG06_NODE_932_length_11441_cov_36.835831_2_plen_114_part_00
MENQHDHPSRPAVLPMLLRSFAAAAVLLALPVAAVPTTTAAAAPSPPSAPAALRCGGSGDVTADSSDVIALFELAKTVCCDQLGETHSPNLNLPGTCKTPGASASLRWLVHAC